MDNYPSAISAHSKMAVVVCATVNRRLSPNHEWAVKHMIGFYFPSTSVVCELCLRGKLKSFNMSNAILFVRGSIHQGDNVLLWIFQLYYYMCEFVWYFVIMDNRDHRMLIEGDSMYLKAFQWNAIPDAGIISLFKQLFVFFCSLSARTKQIVFSFHGRQKTTQITQLKQRKQ